MGGKKNSKSVEALTHEDATRKNIPTAEYQSVMQKEEQSPVRVAYERPESALANEKNRRSRDLDPQLVWRGKDEQDWPHLRARAAPLHPGEGPPEGSDESPDRRQPRVDHGVSFARPIAARYGCE